MKISCPKCSKKEAVKIVYGFPTEEASAEAIKGESKLGGCVITGADPQWYCNNCGYKWQNSWKSLPMIGPKTGASPRSRSLTLIRDSFSGGKSDTLLFRACR